MERHGGEYLLPFRHQLEFWQDGARLKLLRTGQQVGGKTTAGVREIDWRCTGTHPYYPTHKPPVECWVVSPSWKQSVTAQRKFWELCNRDALAPETRFDRKNGFVGTDPCAVYKNGSIVRFRTTNQGGLNLAGATLHCVLIDEPPTNHRVFGELRGRLKRTGGSLLLTLTPINGPVDYLQAMCEAGVISDHQHKLSAEILTPIGSTIEVADAMW